MDLGISGKIALVTGAGSQTGFGRGTAVRLAKEGCDIIILDKDLEGARKTAAEIESLNQKSMAFGVDLTNSSEVNQSVNEALAKFGRIDILVNNAGMSTPHKPFVEKSEEEWEPDININLKSVLIVTKSVLPQMLNRKQGKIVNISSGCGKMGCKGSTIYSAAKAGVVGFSKALAKEVISGGVNVNCVSPGIGDTGFLRSSGLLKTEETPPEFAKAIAAGVPVGRFTLPEDIGSMVAFLVSDLASDIVGVEFDVDGGAIIKF